MTKRQADTILYRIYKALKNSALKVQLCRKIDPLFGVTILSPEGFLTLKVNPIKKGAKGGLVSTILHECLHLLDMSTPEVEVVEREKQMFALLTDRQLTNLFKRVVNIMHKT